MPIDREKFPPLYRTVANNDDGLESRSYVPGGSGRQDQYAVIRGTGGQPRTVRGIGAQHLSERHFRSHREAP